MEFALAIRRLLRHRILLAIGVIVAAFVGIFSTYQITSSGLTARGGVHHSTASTEVLVDAPSSALANTEAPSTTLLSIAQTIANFAPNPDVLNLIGHHAGLQGSQLYAEGPTNLDLPRVIQEPTDMQRNVQIDHEQVPFRLEFNQNPNIPVISIDAQAPTTAGAVSLADAAVAGLRDYIAGLAATGKVGAGHQVVLRQLGAATGSVDAPSAGKELAVLAFLGVFVIWCVLMLAAGRLVDIWRRSGELSGRVTGRRPHSPVVATDAAAATAGSSPESPTLTEDEDRDDSRDVSDDRDDERVTAGSERRRRSGGRQPRKPRAAAVTAASAAGVTESR